MIGKEWLRRELQAVPEIVTEGRVQKEVRRFELLHLWRQKPVLYHRMPRTRQIEGADRGSAEIWTAFVVVSRIRRISITRESISGCVLDDLFGFGIPSWSFCRVCCRHISMFSTGPWRWAITTSSTVCEAASTYRSGFAAFDLCHQTAIARLSQFSRLRGGGLIEDVRGVHNFVLVSQQTDEGREQATCTPKALRGSRALLEEWSG